MCNIICAVFVQIINNNNVYFLNFIVQNLNKKCTDHFVSDKIWFNFFMCSFFYITAPDRVKGSYWALTLYACIAGIECIDIVALYSFNIYLLSNSMGSLLVLEVSYMSSGTLLSCPKWLFKDINYTYSTIQKYFKMYKSFIAYITNHYWWLQIIID